MIREVTANDAQDIVDIYNYYISSTNISFETQALSTEEMSNRIATIHADFPFFVYVINDKVVGYCYAHLWKERKAYQYTYENTIYIDKQYKGKGIGKSLMNRLIDRCKQLDCTSIIACITEENTDSVEFHKKLGFKQVSQFINVGYKFGKWLNVVDYQLILK